MAVFLQIVSTGLTLISASFLLEAARTAPERFANDFFGGDRSLNRRVRSFSDQRANELTGFGLLLLAFASQMWDVLTPPTWDDFDVKIESVIFAIATIFVAYLAARKIRNRVARRSWEKIRKILGDHAIAVDHWIYDVSSKESRKKEY